MPNSISEWFGHRTFPSVCAEPAAQEQQKRGTCPFLSRVLTPGKPAACVKSANSRGVCTVSSNSNGREQDWVACPYRTIGSSIFEHTVSRLFKPAAEGKPDLIPAPRLADATERKAVLRRLKNGEAAYVLFMDKLGGEIDLPGSRRSPKFKLDTTIIGLKLAKDGRIEFGRYAVVEVQTMDFHGTYRHATTALTDALRLHPKDFARQLTENPHWAQHEIEGPNISNVFKRTIYQILFKLRLGQQADCAGCVLALPRSVWESWQPHLGAPEIRPLPDGTWRLDDRPVDLSAKQPGWLTVFDIDSASTITPNPIVVAQDIRIDAQALSRLAFDIAPDEAMRHIGGDAGLKSLLHRRLSEFWPGAFVEPR